MKIIQADPPNIEEIDAAFKVRASGKKIFYCYGDTIYNPFNIAIPPAIMDHEKVHSFRQNGQPQEWWHSYINDLKFRLNEEILAHRAEAQWWARQPDTNKSIPGFRSLVDFHMIQIAKRLSSPLYGSMISFSAAKKEVARV